MLGEQRDRTNEDGAATEELARLGAVDVDDELHRNPIATVTPFDAAQAIVVEDFELFLVLHAERPRHTSIK